MTRLMKSSGIKWLGEVPKEWNIARLKDIKENCSYAIVDGPFGTAISTNDYVSNGIPLARIVNLNGVTLRTDNFVYITEKHADDLKRSAFFLDDIIFAKTGATVGKCAHNTNIEYGILSSSCIKIKISKKYYPRYYYYLFATNQFNEVLRMACNGTTRDTINLKPFANLNCVIPLLKEQKLIASFLDSKCQEIDNVLAKTRSSIQEYKKLKQAIITKAVTKGIRSNCKMKDSGIEWIGEIPEEWLLSKTKYYVNKIGSGKTPKGGAEIYSDTGIMFLRSQNVYNEGLQIEDVSFINESIDEEMSSTRVYPNDVLLNITGASIGRCCIFPEYLQTANVNQHVCIIRCDKNKILPEFMKYIWQSDVGQGYLRFIQTGGNRESLNFEQIANMKITYMPIDEQNEIVSYISQKSLELDALIFKKEQLISELETYKKSLIYEYVTGKKEVPMA